MNTLAEALGGLIDANGFRAVLEALAEACHHRSDRAELTLGGALVASRWCNAGCHLLNALDAIGPMPVMTGLVCDECGIPIDPDAPYAEYGSGENAHVLCLECDAEETAPPETQADE